MVPNGNVDFGFEKLRDELGKTVELSIGEELDEVRAVSGLNMVTLQMPRNVAESLGVPVDVDSAHSRRRAAVFGSMLLCQDLALKDLGKVGGSSCTVSARSKERERARYLPSEDIDAPLYEARNQLSTLYEEGAFNHTSSEIACFQFVWERPDRQLVQILVIGRRRSVPPSHAEECEGCRETMRFRPSGRWRRPCRIVVQGF